jgi:hypothetical protein
VVTAAGLLVDAVTHLDLAGQYQAAAPGGIGEGTLFRIQAAAALLVAGFVLLRGTRVAYLGALVTAGAALAAVLLYRYVDVPPLGPLPTMYEPLWFPAKTATAIAEALASLAAGAALSRAANPSWARVRRPAE